MTIHVAAIRVPCCLPRVHVNHADERFVVREDSRSDGGGGRIFCIRCASNIILNVFESTSLKLSVIAELETITIAVSAFAPSVAIPIRAAILDIVTSSCASTSGISDECLDALLTVTKNLRGLTDVGAAISLATSPSVPAAVRHRGARIVAALCSEKSSPILKSNVVVRVLFDSLVGNNAPGCLKLRAEVATTLDSLCSDDNFVRRALPIWASAGITRCPLLSGSQPAPNTRKSSMHERTAISMTRILAALAREARVSREHKDPFMRLPSEEEFLRALKTSLVSPTRALAAASATMVAELAQLDKMIGHQLMVCGGGIVAYLWDGLRASFAKFKSPTPDSTTHEADMAAFLCALKIIAATSPRNFFDAPGSNQLAASIIIDILDTVERNSSFTSNSYVDSNVNALSLLCGMIEHQFFETDEAAEPTGTTNTISYLHVFRVLSARLIERATSPGVVLSTTRAFATYSTNQASSIQLRIAEWHAFATLLVAFIPTMIFRRSVPNQTVEVHLGAVVKTAVLGALRDVPRVVSLHNDENIIGSGEAAGQDSSECAGCAILDCLASVSRALRDAIGSSQNENTETILREQNRLASALVALLPPFLESGSAQSCNACPTLFVQHLLTTIRDVNMARAKQALRDVGGPFSLLLHAAMDVSNSTTSSRERDSKHLAMMECYMLLCGFDLSAYNGADIVNLEDRKAHGATESSYFSRLQRNYRDDTSRRNKSAQDCCISKDWLFAFRWFAREARALRQQRGHCHSHEASIPVLARLASEILSDLPNERIPSSWPIACRQCAALILVQTCALEGRLKCAQHMLQSSASNNSVVALEALLRPSTFSTLLDDGLLSHAGGIVGLLNLISAAHCQARSQLELPKGLLDQVAHHFEAIDTDLEVITHFATPVLSVLAALPGTATTKALCLCVGRASLDDLAHMVLLNSRLPLQIMRSLCSDDPAASWKGKFWFAFVRTCRALTEAIIIQQSKSMFSCEHEDEKLIDMLLPRVLTVLRGDSQAQWQGAGSSPDTFKQSLQLASQSSECDPKIDAVEIARAFAMIVLRISLSSAVKTNTIHLTALLVENVWESWKVEPSSPQHPTELICIDALLWCLNAANVALAQAMYSHRSWHGHATDSAKARSRAMKILTQHGSDVLTLMMKHNSTSPLSLRCHVALLIHLLLIAEASKVSSLADSQSSRRIDGATIHEGNIIDVLEIPLHALDPTPRQQQLDMIDSAKVDAHSGELVSAHRVVACWTLAALLELPAAHHFVFSSTGDNRKAEADRLCNLIRLRTQEVITSPLGSRSDAASEGACAALVRLFSLERQLPQSLQAAGNMDVWHHFSSNWLLSREPGGVSPYVALYVTTYSNQRSVLL